MQSSARKLGSADLFQLHQTATGNPQFRATAFAEQLREKSERRKKPNRCEWGQVEFGFAVARFIPKLPPGMPTGAVENGVKPVPKPESFPIEKIYVPSEKEEVDQA